MNIFRIALFTLMLVLKVFDASSLKADGSKFAGNWLGFAECGDQRLGFFLNLDKRDSAEYRAELKWLTPGLLLSGELLGDTLKLEPQSWVADRPRKNWTSVSLEMGLIPGTDILSGVARGKKTCGIQAARFDERRNQDDADGLIFQVPNKKNGSLAHITEQQCAGFMDWVSSGKKVKIGTLFNTAIEDENTMVQILGRGFYKWTASDTQKLLRLARHCTGLMRKTNNLKWNAQFKKLARAFASEGFGIVPLARDAQTDNISWAVGVALANKPRFDDLKRDVEKAVQTSKPVVSSTTQAQKDPSTELAGNVKQTQVGKEPTDTPQPVVANHTERCLTLAGSPRETGISDTGIPFHKIDTHVAIEACRLAVAQEPTSENHYRLGRALESAENFAEAVTLYRKSADGGYVVAMVNLAKLTRDGLGVRRDTEEAVRLFQAAADAGDAVGQANLGYLYSNGNGVPKSDIMAARWFKAAARQNNAFALKSLGVAYYNGVGVPQDRRSGKLLLQRSAKLGNPDAKRILTDIRRIERNRAPDNNAAGGALAALVILGIAGLMAGDGSASTYEPHDYITNPVIPYEDWLD